MTELTALGSSPGLRTGAGGRQAAPGRVLLIVCAGVALASLDLFVVNLALPRMAADLGAADLGGLSWVLNGYAVVYAALLVYFGRLADRHRRDQGFLLGVAIFTVASAACAAATNVPMLIAFRLLQAAGAALLTPTSLGLVLAVYEPARRPGAVRAWTAVGGIAAGIGPVVGGLLVEASWRWVFLVNVPVGVAALIAGRRMLPRVEGHPGERPDPFGAVLVTAGVALLILGLVEGGERGWESTLVIGSLVAAVLLLAAFAWHSRRSSAPLIHPSLFGSRIFTGASLVAFFFSAAFGAMLLSIALWGQSHWGWSALRTGLAIAPGPLMVPLVSFGLAGRLIARYGVAAVITAGSVIFGAGTAWWALAIGTTPDYAADMLGGMLLTGIGVGLTLPTMMAAASAPLAPSEFATGSAVVNMIRQAGLAVGVAVLVAILGGTSDEASLTAFHAAWWITTAFALLGVLPALLLLREQASSPRRDRA